MCGRVLCQKSDVYLLLNNCALFMLLFIGVVLLLIHFVTLNICFLIPYAWQAFVEIIFASVLNLVNKQISADDSSIKIQKMSNRIK